MIKIIKKQEIWINPLNTLLLLKSLKILKKFKNFFLSFNGDRALPRMIQNVVLGSFESIFNAFFKVRSFFIKIK